MTTEINPLQIPETLLAPLCAFLSNTPMHLIPQDETLHADGIGKFFFTHSLLWRARGAGKSGKRFEIFNVNRQFAKGGQAVVYTSEGTLRIDDDTFNYVEKEKQRVLKKGSTAAISTVEKELHRHRSVLRCKAPTEVDGNTYIVMRKAPGQLLRQILDTEIATLSIEKRFLLVLGLLDALWEQANQHGIVHRDLKPENILVDLRLGLVTLVDFGIARYVDQAKNTPVTEGELDVFQGTHGYAPPEEYDGLAPSIHADTYSIAIAAAQIFGAMMKNRSGGLAIISQSIRYSACMDYTNKLYVQGLSERCLIAIETILTKMSVPQPELRLGLQEARAAFAEIYTSFLAGIYTPASEALQPQPSTDSGRRESCWLKPQLERGSEPSSRSLPVNAVYNSLELESEADVDVFFQSRRRSSSVQPPISNRSPLDITRYRQTFFPESDDLQRRGAVALISSPVLKTP